MSKECLFYNATMLRIMKSQLCILLTELKNLKIHYFKNIRNFYTSYKANRKSWMIKVIFQDYSWQRDKKMKLENHKIILFVDQCISHNNKILKTVYLDFSAKLYQYVSFL